jgi:hypothetical protein
MFEYALLCQKFDEILWWFMDWDANYIVETYKADTLHREQFNRFIQYMNWYRSATEDDLQYRNQYFHKLIVQDVYKDYELFEDFYEYLDSLYQKDKQRLADIEFFEIFDI